MNSHLSFLAAAGLLTGSFFLSSTVAQSTSRISVDSAGLQANFTSHAPSVSADGRYVAFDADATTLVSGDTNSVSDVFVRDRQTNQTRRVSVSSAGVQGDGSSWYPSLSADGRYVAYWSSATNLVSGDTNGVFDVFVHDLQTAQTSRVSVKSTGAQASSGSYSPTLSADGRYVAFWSYANDLVAVDANGWADIFVHDRQTGQTTRVSVDSFGVEGNAQSNYPSISGDGRFVAFESLAANLAPGDDVSITDVFVHDRQTAQTIRISADSAGVKGVSPSLRPAISTDGRYVAFQSDAGNLVAADVNNATDVFVHDLQTSQTTRVSVASGGVPGDYISGDPAISADGRHVAFASLSTNLVPLDTNASIDVFVHDRSSGQTTRASVATGGAQGNNGSVAASISSDGRYIAFESAATNLVPLDSNQNIDVFMRDGGAPVGWANAGPGLAGANGVPQLGASGALVASGVTTFQISSAAGSTVGALVLGTTNLSLPIYGGVLVPDALLLLPLATSASGQASKQLGWPAGLPLGLFVYAQTWLLDPAGVQGFAATNALTAIAN